MESDDVNRACSGASCYPDVTSTTVVPALEITTASGRAFSRALTQFNVTATGDCGTANDLKFEVSSDGGTTYKYWNGTAWTTVTTASSYAEASTLSTINTNLATLASSGTFHFRALLPGRHRLGGPPDDRLLAGDGGQVAHGALDQLGVTGRLADAHVDDAMPSVYGNTCVLTNPSVVW